MSISWSLSSGSSNTNNEYWKWGSTPAVFNIGTSPSLILSEVSEPRLINYRAEADSNIKIKLWFNAPTTGDHEMDSFGGHNLKDMPLASKLQCATVSGTAKIVVNTAELIII